MTAITRSCAAGTPRLRCLKSGPRSPRPACRPATKREFLPGSITAPGHVLPVDEVPRPTLRVPVRVLVGPPTGDVCALDVEPETECQPLSCHVIGQRFQPPVGTSACLRAPSSPRPGETDRVRQVAHSRRTTRHPPQSIRVPVRPPDPPAAGERSHRSRSPRRRRSHTRASAAPASRRGQDTQRRRGSGDRHFPRRSCRRCSRPGVPLAAQAFPPAPAPARLPARRPRALLRWDARAPPGTRGRTIPAR